MRTPSTDGSGTIAAVIWGLTGRKETAGRPGRRVAFTRFVRVLPPTQPM
jgi:hypothetical protein